MACSDECLSLCSDSFIADLKRMVHKQSKRINDYISYEIKYILTDYVLLKEDTKGDILLLCQTTKPINITIPTEANSNFMVGSSVTVVQDSDFNVMLVGEEGVTFSPADAAITRRSGSAISLIYEGGDLWRIVGELP